MEIASKFPSHNMYRRDVDFLARFMAKSVRLFLYTMVSGLLTYLRCGFSDVKSRPLKAITLPRRSMMGIITRLRNMSYKLPRSLSRTTPLASISSLL